MIARPSGRFWAVLAMLCAAAVHATPVTVKVTTSVGQPAVDTLIIFDSPETPPSRKSETAVIDQVNKRFVPHVSIVRTGTAATFPNSDHIRHQVYSFSPAKTFSLKLYAGSPKVDVVFDKPGLVVLGCNIHDSMVAFVGVVDSPYFGKIPDTGSFTIDLPAGHYRLHVWHPNLMLAQSPPALDVADAPLTLPITVQLDPDRDTVAAWPQ